MAQIDFKNGVTATSLSATAAAFTLLGGRYAFGVNATWGGGNVVIQVLMPDSTTYVTTATYTADNTDVLDLPAGTFKIAITTATAVQYFLVPIPYRQAA